ncbi:MAG: CHRD domain-containing protein [Planctomycetota bacterium]|jgi:hypothetical protein
MKIVAATLLSAVLFAVPLSSQVEFWAAADGFQEVPPVPGTLAGAWGKFVYAPGPKTLSYEVHAWGFDTAITGAHLHKGAFGVGGGIIEVPLIGTGPDWFGTSPVLTATQLADLRSGDWYLNVHTTFKPAGEVRGQVYMQPAEFGARLDEAQEVPPPISFGGSANANFTLNQDRTLTYSIVATGLSGAITGAHIHDGLFGSPGIIDVVLTVTGFSTVSGTTAPLSDDTITRLQTLGSYVNLHTGLNPLGEVRGQIVRSGIPYGPPSEPVSGAISIYVTGAPTNVGGGGHFVFHIEKGLPRAPRADRHAGLPVFGQPVHAVLRVRHQRAERSVQCQQRPRVPADQAAVARQPRALAVGVPLFAGRWGSSPTGPPLSAARSRTPRRSGAQVTPRSCASSTTALRRWVSASPLGTRWPRGRHRWRAGCRSGPGG